MKKSILKGSMLALTLTTSISISATAMAGTFSLEKFVLEKAFGNNSVQCGPFDTSDILEEILKEKLELITCFPNLDFEWESEDNDENEENNENNNENGTNSDSNSDNENNNDNNEEKPEAELPETELPETELPEVEKPEIEFPEVEFPEVELPELEDSENEEDNNNNLGGNNGNTGGNNGNTGGNTGNPDSNIEGTESISAYAQEVVRLVNIEREKVGLSALTMDSATSSAAQVRAGEIHISFSHTRPDGRSFATALQEKGVSYKGAGENIAIGQKTPEEVVIAWMNSDGHRANILNSSFTEIGVGYYNNAWVQLFTY